jgi:hypothetical protein
LNTRRVDRGADPASAVWGLSPLHRANARYFRLAAPKKCFGCAVCDVVYVRVGECAAVEEGSSSFLGFFGWQTLLVVRFESRLWPDSTTGLFWYKPENRVSLGGTLRRRYAMVHIGKPRPSRRCAAPPVCYGAHRKTMSLRHAEPPVCFCKVQTVEETRRGRCQCPSDGASFQAKRGASQLVC